jgi:hypothetical protein
MEVIGMDPGSLDLKGQALANEKNLPHVLENTKLHAWKDKNLAADLNASGATGASSGGQTSGETHDGKNLCLLLQ